MEEVVTSQFNINDYIWYIVGGVALFFVLVGFIADKSGLAKKTFSKDSNGQKSKPSVTPIVPVVPVSVPENNDIVEPVKEELPISFIEADAENLDNINQEVLISDDVDVLESSDMSAEGINQDETFEQIDTFNQDDVSSVDGNSMILDDQSLGSTDDSEFMLDENEKADEVHDETVEASSDDVILNDSNSVIEEPILGSTNDSEFMLDDNKENIEINDEITEITSDDAWGSVSEENKEKVEEVELPNLDDVNSDEEDVWKF